MEVQFLKEAFGGREKPYHLRCREGSAREEQGSFGQGDFIDAGYEAGLRDGLEFLAERMNDQNALPFLARVGLVQDRYSYLEFVSRKDTEGSPSSLELNERILLTRSGEIGPAAELVDSNSSQ